MSSENVQFAKDGVRAFNERDVEWVIANSIAEVEWYPAIASGVEGEPFRGHEGLRKFFEQLNEVWEEFRLEPEEIRDLGDRILVLAQVSAKGMGGVAFEQPLDAIWKVRGGKLTSGRSYLDREQALQAAGQEVR